MDAKTEFDNTRYSLVVDYHTNSKIGSAIVSEIGSVMSLKMQRGHSTSKNFTRFVGAHHNSSDHVGSYAISVVRAIKRWCKDYGYSIKFILINQHLELIEGGQKDDFDSLSDCFGYGYLLSFEVQNRNGNSKAAYHAFVKRTENRPVGLANRRYTFLVDAVDVANVHPFSGDL